MLVSSFVPLLYSISVSLDAHMILVITEEENVSDIPHRGRLLELPGEVMPGAWKAQVLQEGSYDCSYKRISLRHHNAMDSPLEYRLHEDDDVPVVIVNPLKYRVESFIDQGVFNDEEIENEEKIVGNAFLGCISLIWFDGFTSASDAVNLANDAAEGLLKLCESPTKMCGANDLCKLVRKGVSNDADKCVQGVLYRCRLEFDADYSILVSYNGFEIDAVDGMLSFVFCASILCLSLITISFINITVVFKHICAQTGITGDALNDLSRRGLTPSLISHHLDCVGSSVSDVMHRFKYGDENEAYGYMPPNQEKLRAEERDETMPEEPDSSEVSLEDFGCGALDLFENGDKDINASDLFVADKAKLLKENDTSPESPSAGREHMQVINTSATLEETEGEYKQKSEYQNLVSSLENESVKNPCSSPDPSFSHASETMKNRSNTAIQSREDVESDDEEKGNIEHTPKTVPDMPVIQKLPSCIAEITKRIDSQNDDKAKALENAKSSATGQLSVEAYKTNDILPEYETHTSDGVVADKTTEKNIDFALNKKEVNSSTVQAFKALTGSKKTGSLAKVAKHSSKMMAFKGKKTSRKISNTIEAKSISRRSSGPSHDKSLRAPATKRTAPQTSDGGINCQLFQSNCNSAPAKKKEYISDLFGENESMFGIPTIKTPATRKKTARPSFLAIESVLGEKVLQQPFFHINDKRLPSDENSPVVTPSRKAADSTESHDVFYSPITSSSLHEASSFTNDSFHDVPTDLLEEKTDESPVTPKIGLAESPQANLSHLCFHDVYYGQGFQSPNATVASPSNIAALMESPDRLRAFHDYYYGRGPYKSSDEESILQSNQPLHDVYFGQYMDDEQLYLNELTESLDNVQASYDAYFGQQDIEPSRFSDAKTAKTIRIVKMNQHHKKPNKLCFVLLMISSMFQSVAQPKNTRYHETVIRIKDVTVFTKASHSSYTHAKHEIGEQSDKVRSGWISSWYQGY